MKFRIFYTADGGGSGTGGAPAGGEPAGGTPAPAPAGGTPPAGSGPKTYDEAAVQKLIADKEKSWNQRNAQMLERLKTLEQAGLSPEDKDRLTSEIESLQKAMMSKEELASMEMKNLKGTFERDLGKVTKERDTWQERFRDTLITQNLTAAAAENNAESPAQIMMMFKGSTYIDEIKDANNRGTGQFTAKLKFLGIDPETKTQREFDLPVADAMKKLRQDGLNNNLFRHSGTPGGGSQPNNGGAAGGSNNGAPSPEQFSSPEAFQEAYFAYRKTHNLDGSKRT